ncbi:MAG TPA: hypothetical protein VKR61_05465 [Bryobacteraceae bacterium]|nr:hypothetical protein [Bryobacteraceae bacterium]
MHRVLPVFFAMCLAGAAQEFRFAVSGDSRNCGDVVMPAVASGVLKSGASFYWHLGDFRAIYDFDEDMAPPAALRLSTPHLNIISYLTKAWPDFIDHQLKPFGGLEIFLAPGNHEMIFPQKREMYRAQFESYLNSGRLREQRDRDKDAGAFRTYYHWTMNGTVDFISLDNASDNAFDAAQMAWIRERLAEDGKSRAITTIVVGMHEALPGSKGLSHSMCDSPAGVASGREVYNRLWDLRKAGKKVYLLASHSHFVMDDVYNTPYWAGRVLPGWIVGTAGAVRYRLPPGQTGSAVARTDVYGYLAAAVAGDGSIRFEFKEMSLDDLRMANAGKTPDSLVQWCYEENKEQTIPAPGACTEGARK